MQRRAATQSTRPGARRAMKLLVHPPIPFALLALGSTLAGPWAAREASTFAPARQTSAPGQQADFMSEFRKAMQAGAREEMVKLVRTRQDEAVTAVLLLCEAIAEASSEQLESERQALDTAWREAHKTKFVTKMYEYYSFIPSDQKEMRARLQNGFEAAVRKFQEGQRKKDTVLLSTAAVEFLSLAQDYEEIADAYKASQCWGYQAICFDENLRGREADLRRACEGYKKCCEQRKAIELFDRFYNESQARREVLEAAGYGEAPPAPAPGEGSGETGGEKGAGEARGAGAQPGPAAGGAPLVLTPTFEIVRDLSTIRRPIFAGDEIYPIWGSVFLQGRDSVGKFGAMENSPAVIRTGEAKVGVDVDGDGKVDVDLPVNGTLNTVQITLGEGEEKRAWAFLATIGLREDTYQGMKFNLGPDGTQMGIYIAPAASMKAVVNGIPIQVIDDNMDGIYGSAPKPWGYLGTLPAAQIYQNDVDSIVVGGAKVARPWSELVDIGGTWYRMAVEAAGTRLIASPDPQATGILRLDFKGPKPDFVVVRGRENLSKCFFDLVEGGRKGVSVPVGTYDLFVGQVSAGKRLQMQKALIAAHPNTPSWTVTVGGTTAVELGAPFGFDFAVTQDEESVAIDGRSVAVQGRAKELYLRLWNCTVKPEVNLRKTGSKRGSKEGRMRPVESQEETAEAGVGWEGAWTPISLKLPKKAKDEIEVQLVEKKNPLFGEIESEWRK
jgi:hypothetical protein